METVLVLGIVGVAGAIMGQRAWRAARKLTEPLPPRPDCAPSNPTAASGCSCAGCPIADKANACNKEITQ